ALEPTQPFDDVLERFDAVAQAGGLLVAQLVRQAREPSAQPRQRPALEQAVELTLGARRQRTGRERCPPPARDRAELGRRLSDDELLAAALQVDAALLPAAARVRGRIELADQPQLLERG